MKILVPTDFSEYAQYALNLAGLIAKRTVNSKIDLWHCTEWPEKWTEGSNTQEWTKDLTHQLADQSKKHLEAWKDGMEKNQVECDYHLVGGKYIDQLEDWLEMHEYDLIVMGSHGASGKKEWFMGSNAQKTIRRVEIPVLVIKQPVGEAVFKRVAFATDLTLEEKRGLQALLSWKEILGIEEIHILVIDTLSWFSQPRIVVRSALEDFEKIISSTPTKTHFYKDYSVQAGIRHFIEEYDIDLVVNAHGDKSNFAIWLLGSQTEMLVNHADIPVLVFHHGE